MMSNYIYITPEQARITHAKTIEYRGGGTREEIDFGRLESVLCNIQNDEWYPSIISFNNSTIFKICATMSL